PQVPLDREGWQLTRPNLYSWYNPSPVIQREIWMTLETTRLTEDGPSLLSSLLGTARPHHPDRQEPQGYDPRFFKSLWDLTAALAGNQLPMTGLLQRGRAFFSPTLRDGSLVRTGPQSVDWIGMENSSFQLMVAELIQLFRGPGQPPLWAIGSGIEVYARDQL